MVGKKIYNLIGNILMLVSLIYIFNRVRMHGLDIRGLFSWKILTIGVIAIVIQAIIVVCFANIYELLIKKNSGIELANGSTIREYCRSNLLKYMPGNIFHYIGRNQIAIEQGVSYFDVNSTTIVEMLLLLFAGIVNTIIFSGRYAFRCSIENYEINIFIVLITTVLVVCVIIIVHRVSTNFRNITVSFSMRLRKLGMITSIKIVCLYMLIFIVSGISFILVLYRINGDIPLELIFPAIGLYSFSWMVGFMTPGAPAGIGIREVMMSTLLSRSVDTGIIMTTVLLFRMITILADVFGYLFSGIYIKVISSQ